MPAPDAPARFANGGAAASCTCLLCADTPTPCRHGPTTGATLFTGGGGADIGMMQAGINVRWGLEINERIAAVANRNLGGHVLVGDILAQDPASFEPVDVLHASPPCPSFSPAKTGAVETAHDIRLARQTAHFVTALRPRVFTLENVWPYRWSKSWRTIENALHGAGYWVSVAQVNAADYGVPQTRKRMIVRAVLDGWVPMLPEPEPWRNWLDAIADLIDDLPDTELAPWQVARLAEMPQMSSLVLISSGNNSKPLTVRRADEPAYTITASMEKTPARAVVDHQIKAISPRCLARWQTIPDWYELPESKTLAAKIIGNAVPPLLMEKIYRNSTPAQEAQP